MESSETLLLMLTISGKKTLTIGFEDAVVSIFC